MQLEQIARSWLDGTRTQGAAICPTELLKEIVLALQLLKGATLPPEGRSASLVSRPALFSTLGRQHGQPVLLQV